MPPLLRRTPFQETPWPQWEGRASSRPSAWHTPGTSPSNPAGSARTKPGPPQAPHLGGATSSRATSNRDFSRNSPRMCHAPGPSSFRRFVVSSSMPPLLRRTPFQETPWSLWEGRASSRPSAWHTPGTSPSNPAGSARTKPGPPQASHLGGATSSRATSNRDCVWNAPGMCRAPGPSSFRRFVVSSSMPPTPAAFATTPPAHP